MKTLELDIIAEDITTNEHDGSKCPIARALRRVCDIPFHVKRTFLVFFDKDNEVVYREEIASVRLPNKLREFICDYDAGKPVLPFKFTWTIDLPSIGL